ncbi:hypothetical protein AHiyo8_01030 [Arthrobacter sp. Hiyo8]|nr:hypothetical protein AHiyo8_01030 [Arthrobacter sp. Hiyo8]
MAGKKPTSKNAAGTASCLVVAVRAVGISEPAQALSFLSLVIRFPLALVIG